MLNLNVLLERKEKKTVHSLPTPTTDIFYFIIYLFIFLSSFRLILIRFHFITFSTWSNVCVDINKTDYVIEIILR